MHDIQAITGDNQFAIGQKAALERLVGVVEAAMGALDDHLTVSLDCSNAFNTLKRQTVIDTLQQWNPELAQITGPWLLHPAKYHYTPQEGASHTYT
eukprot:6558267-Prorocentrum_lima.AAC.1